MLLKYPPKYSTEFCVHKYTAIVLVKICQHLPKVGSNINSLHCLVNLTQWWAKLNQTLGNNLPNNSSKSVSWANFMQHWLNVAYGA